MDPLLFELGRRVRRLRTDKSLILKDLAASSGVSVRFLSALEAGNGNISVLKLARVAEALGTTPDRLLRPQRRIVALVGLRGAGKSTVGALLAQQLGRPFVELDREIEARAGLSLAELFALHGEDSFRRLERSALADLLGRPLMRETGCVLSTGGSLPTDSGTWSLLKDRAVTVWLRARPEQHFSRVLAQGDRRPMAGRRDALADIARLLASREPLYAEAEITVDTSEVTVEEAVRRVVKGIREA